MLRVSKVLWTVLIVAFGFTSCGVDKKTSTPKELNTTEEALKALQTISDGLTAISQSVMVNDKARLQVLGNSVGQSAAVVKEKGLGNIRSVNSLRKLVMYFIYSEQFMEFIRTEKNSGSIDSVLNATINKANADSIRVSIGYDEDPLGTILADNLDVILNRLDELVKASEVPNDIRESLRPLVARVGYVRSLALGQGDRPIPYKEGQKLCAEINAIYPQLDKLAGSIQLFQRAQDIRGTNEFLKDFLQVNSDQ
jgi:hypothetical protein